MTNEATQSLKLSRWQRLLQRLFPMRVLEPMPEEKGWAPGEYSTITIARFDGWDRVRLLFSPWVRVEVRSQTDRPVNKARSRAAVCVLRPGFKPPPPQVPAVEQPGTDWAGRFMTFEEVVDDLERWAVRHPGEALWVKGLGERGALIETHHGFGRWVRNWYGLWREGNPLTMLDYRPQVEAGVDGNPKHPDAVSARLIEALYERLRG